MALETLTTTVLEFLESFVQLQQQSINLSQNSSAAFAAVSKTKDCRPRKGSNYGGIMASESHQAMLKFQRKSINSLNFAEPVEERYLDNFVIDI